MKKKKILNNVKRMIVALVALSMVGNSAVYAAELDNSLAYVQEENLETAVEETETTIEETEVATEETETTVEETEVATEETEITVEETEVTTEETETTVEETEMATEETETTVEETEVATEETETTIEETETATEETETTVEETEMATEETETTIEETEVATEETETTIEETETELLEESAEEVLTESEIMLLSESGQEGWVQEGDAWYYYQDGQKLTDTEISEYDEASGEYCTYRLDTEGKRIISAWYNDEYENSYYYDINGHKATGLTIIDGESYYFNSNGRMMRDYTFCDENSLYYVGQDGKVEKQVSLVSDGWKEMPDGWYYVQSGTLLKGEWLTVKGYTYYFDYNGRMLANNTLWTYEGSKDCYYRFDKNGHMITGWYQDEWDRWYCYGSDGRSLYGKNNINGTWYYFNYEGAMQKNYTAEVDGKLDYFGEDGTLQKEIDITTDGWKEMPDGWYYVQSGTLLKGEWLTVKGYTYYFDYNGRMLANNTLWFYEDSKDCYYRFDENGHMITGWYQDEWDNRYYYGSDGQSLNGKNNINGTWYYFNYEGIMQRNCTAEVDGKLDYFGEDGTLQKEINITTDGWKEMPDGWYYVQSGTLLREEWLTVKGHTYYFNGNGLMYANSTNYIYDEKGNEYIYRFDESGYMVTGWYEEYDTWYYYDIDGRAVSGMKEINNNRYYFGYDGQMLTSYTVDVNGKLYYFGETGKCEKEVSLATDGWKEMPDGWYYAKSGESLKNKWLTLKGYTYYFDYNGRMSNGEQWIYDENERQEYKYRFDENGHMITGWYKEYSAWYYYDSNGRAVSGVNKIGNDWYYFDNSGYMITNCSADANGYLYYFGENGKAEKEISLATDGWKEMPDGWYYAKSGNILRSEWLTVNGYAYYLDNTGIMCKDGIQWIYDEVKSGVYRFDENGHMVTGWYQDDDGDWYYYSNKGYATAGLVEVKGKIYYFASDGRSYANTKFFYNNKIYVADGNGVCTLISDGWVDSLYYVENGTAVTGWKKLSGAWYYFDTSSGEKYSNDYYLINGQEYYFDYKGVMKTGWVQPSYGTWIYADSSGVLACNEWRTVNGKKYYFDDVYMVKGIYLVDGKYQLFDENGVWQKDLSSQQDGWFKEGSDWYFIENGKFVENETRKINGKTYAFGYDGRMITNGYADVYYFGSDGAAIVNQWKKEWGNIWRYYDENGECVFDEWKQINGSWYYFRSGHMMQSDTVIDGKLYHFASNGVSDGIGKALSEGWNLIDGQYYYYQDNAFIEEAWVTIGSNKYYFDYMGRMAYQTMIYDDDAVYYVNKNGIMVKGWYNNGYEWYYAGNDGKLVDGLQTINGVRYYFKYHELCTTDTITEDGKNLYIINSNGVITDIVQADSNGWKKSATGEWYYIAGGKYVTGRQMIRGKQYYFNRNNGQLVTNKLIEGVGYADSNGELKFDGLFNGSYILNGKEWYSGPIVIDGKDYYFYEAKVTAGVYFVDGNYYFYDGKGGRTTVTLKEGWNQISDSWYYVVDGRLCRGGEEEISGKYYYFERNGKMSSNIFQEIYLGRGKYTFMYLGENGLPVKGWKEIDGKKYYFDTNGYALLGKYEIGGTTYIFDKYGRLIQ